MMSGKIYSGFFKNVFFSQHQESVATVEPIIYTNGCMPKYVPYKVIFVLFIGNICERRRHYVNFLFSKTFQKHYFPFKNNIDYTYYIYSILNYWNRCNKDCNFIEHYDFIEFQPYDLFPILFFTAIVYSVL